MSAPAGQCPHCASLSGNHTLACSSPAATGLYFAYGNETCDLCGVGFQVGDPYTHIEHTPGVEVPGEPDRLVCLGCAAVRACGGPS